MNPDVFLKLLQDQAQSFTNAVATTDGDWIVKGIIDVYSRIYPLSLDTKMISKTFEILLVPTLTRFAEENGFVLHLPPQQNFYPDLTFISKTDSSKFALDIKSTYRVGTNRVSGMTLGAFTGYFRNRDSTKNTLYPYNEYSGHFALGIVYSQHEQTIFLEPSYTLDTLDRIPSALHNFIFFVQPKYRIASAIPGSGNTKNIGSITLLDMLMQGEGPFAQLGEEVYDDYWMYYLTVDMAQALGLARPYTNLKTYLEYKQKGRLTLEQHAETIHNFADFDSDSNGSDMEVN